MVRRLTLDQEIEGSIPSRPVGDQMVDCTRLDAKEDGTWFRCGYCGYVGMNSELPPDDSPKPHPCGKDQCPECGEEGYISCCLLEEDVIQ